MLDLVSGGRVSSARGETASGAELGGFGVDRATKREQWAEALDVVTRMIVEEPFAGRRRPLRLDADAQRRAQADAEAPPAAVGRVLAARDDPAWPPRRGIGALSFSFVEPEEAKEWVDEYYEIIASERCVPAGLRGQPERRGRAADDVPRRRGRRRSSAASTAPTSSATRWRTTTLFGDHRPGRTNIWEEFLARRDEVGFAREIVNADDEPLGVKILQQGLGSLRGAIGTPDQVRDLVARYEAAGVDQVIFVSPGGPQPPRAHLRVAGAVRRAR